MNYPKLGISVGQEIKFFYPKEIMYCRSEGNYSELFFEDGRKLTSAKKLKELENILPDDSFVRVHHSYIVNLQFVAKFINDDVKEIEMTNGDRVLVSRRKKAEFLANFMKI